MFTHLMFLHIYAGMSILSVLFHEIGFRKAGSEDTLALTGMLMLAFWK